MTDFHHDILRILSQPGAACGPERIDRLMISGSRFEERTQGWNPGTVSRELGPALRELRDGGLIEWVEQQTDRGRHHVYVITEAGRRRVDGVEAATRAA